jgi:transposase-like protein
MVKKTVKKTHLIQRRVFSEEFKKRIVKEIEKGQYTVLQASREFEVNLQTVYNWLYRYSRYLQKNKVLIVEEQSEQRKRQELEQRIKDLEAALGRKQMEIDMLNKLIEIAGQEYNTDLKKNILKQSLSGSGSTKESDTATP